MLDFSKNEEETLNYWKEKGTLAKVREKNKSGKPFYFLDGPPYVSGDLHPGQMWVKSMKDVMLRYKRFRGYYVYDRAGYDVHGLPIERKVEAKLNLTSKKEIETKIGVENFINSCKEFVEGYIGRMDKDYIRFGVSLDFSNPYVPSRKEYMETAWGFVKMINQKRLLHKDKRSTTYCVGCNTAVSQGSMEVEYRNDTDPSVLVEFKVNEKLSKPRVDLGENAYLVIWTTTPWTLPANVAVAAHPKEIYVVAKVGEKRLIVAKSRLDALLSIMDESAMIEKEFYGSELEGIYYTSPLEAKVPEQKKFRKYHKILLSEEMVNVSEGSGLVHIAPGHGNEDYLLGKKNKLPIFSPVSTEGRYTAEAGGYDGLEILNGANKVVIEDLRALGSLIDASALQHSYPHCWRCDTKLIFIATEQWFVNIRKIKEKLLRENTKVSWHPPEAQKWQEELLRSSPDWTISRQRYWGIPMPIWTCECGETLVIGSLGELRENAVNQSMVDSLHDLHKPYIDRIMLKCVKCSKEMQRIPDVLDVWFDSAIAFRASLSEADFKRLFPVDFILEGRDQLRGWFSYQLKVAVAVYGKRPFNTVVTHGMMLGEDGREMHKKLGNYVPLEEILKTTTVDAFRLWCTSHTPELDLIFSREKINEANKVVMLLYNISNLYAEYSDAVGYKPPKVKKPSNLEKLENEEAWIVSRMNRTIRDVTASLENYEIYKAVNTLKKFIIEDLSRFYLKAAKKKALYSERKMAKQVIDTVNYLLFNTLLLASVIIPFSTEKLYLRSYGKESIFLENWPKYKEKLISDEIEEGFGYAIETITAILSAREKANLRLRQPLRTAIVEVTNEEALNSLQRMAGVIEDYTNIRKVELKLGESGKKTVRPLFENIGPEFKENAGAVGEALKGADAEAVMKDISSSGHYSLHTEKGTFNIAEKHFTVIEGAARKDALSFKYGSVSLDATISEELREEALVREFERAVQLMRKGMGLKKAERIKLYCRFSPEMKAIIKKNEKDILKAIAANQMSELEEGMESKEVEIDGETVKIKIAKL